MAGLGLDIDAALGEKVDTKAGLAPLPESPVTTELALQTDKALEVLADKAKSAGVTVPAGPSTVVPQTAPLLSCRGLLNEESRAKVRAYAEKQLPGLLNDPNRLGDFGREAVDPLNALAGKMLDQAGRAANIPELVTITNQLDDRIRGLTNKYDRGALADSRKTYEELKGKVLGFFHKFKNMLEMLLKDAKGVQAYLDSLEATLEDYRHQLRHNVAMCNQLYTANEDAIGKLVVVIAAMEEVRDLAAAHAESIQLEGDAATVRVKREQRERVVEFIQALDVRIGEFQQRLFVAWATSPQIRNIRAISYGLGQRLALLQLLTIPVFKLTIVQWVALQQAAEAGKVTGAVSEANEAALRAFANAGAELVPQVAEQIQRPSTSPETILVLAESLATQAKGIALAYEYGIKARAEVSARIVAGAHLIAQAEDAKAEQVLELVRQASQASDLTVDTADDQLPDFVLENADSVLSTGQLSAK